MSNSLKLDAITHALNAISEPTRLRILVLLDEGDLTVSDLTAILGQSQPRVSRHLKLLQDARLVSRHQEGSWAYFHLEEISSARALLGNILSNLSRQDNWLEADRRRLAEVRQKRQDKAAAYFSAHAAEWDSLRQLYVDEKRVEQALLQLIGRQAIGSLLDIGTGTGSMLKLFAPFIQRAIGIDNNPAMLAVARANLERHNIAHTQLRTGEAIALPFEDSCFHLITIHQLLHFLEEPQAAVREAARVLQSGGRLLLVDFAPHTQEFLREEHAHLRLGFSDGIIDNWLQKSGLMLDNVQNIVPQAAHRNEKLTTKIWLAHKL